MLRGLAFAVAIAAPFAGVEAKTFKEMFPNVELTVPQAKEFVDGLDFKQGDVRIGSIGVKMRVPTAFYFLEAADARKVVLEAWGNPPSTAQGVLGMIMPANKMPIEDTWGAIVTFDADGYVSDADAAQIDYTQLLREMQEAIAEGSKERVAAGFSSLRLVGWASQPFYDKASNKLHWAKELEFGGNPAHTLNYDVRALGRKGVLKLNFVASMSDLETIRGVIPAVMDMPEFEEGHRYTDFVPGADKVAAYGIGGLIAGKLLSKAGLLAVALVFLKKGWIFVVLGLGALLKFVGRLFRRKKPDNPMT